ncbi:MAG: Slp family lipoprotein [Proteobacteria bacterium]|nr:Slp family lipoprotein [Pseudomonadota bacterium]
MRNLPIATALLAALALGGCATVPQQLAGQNFNAITPQIAARQDVHGDRVRWGGNIVAVVPQADKTCFEILSRELFSDARPRPRSQSSGRFIACGNGFYDPELYKKDREITVTGTLAGTQKHPVGGYDYTYAMVDADNIYLWPVRTAEDRRGAWPYYYDPFWGPWGPYWGGGWWTPPVVIVRPPPPKH